jgi:SprT protein
MEKLHNSLTQFEAIVPLQALSCFSQLIGKRPLDIFCKSGRKSKYGDFKYFSNGKTPIITINSNMPEETTLFILAHEIAHFITRHKYKKHLPHGNEWKQCFNSILVQLIDTKCFKKTTQDAVRQYMKTTTATVSKKSTLHSLLFPENTHEKHHLTIVNDLNLGARFTLTNSNRIFILGEKNRTRFHCFCETNKKSYLIQEHTKVKPLK